MLLQKKKNQPAKGNRLLISITVLGSAGPIRFVVNEAELVAAVIDTALKSYAREGRLPVLGSDLNNFVLYCSSASTEALSPWETIGSLGFRNFMLCKKPQPQLTSENGKQSSPPMAGKTSSNWTTSDDGEQSSPPTPMARKSSGNWKAWFNKSLNLKISSH